MTKVIEVIDLIKEFPIHKKTPGFKEWAVKKALFTDGDGNSRFAALKSVSFSVEKGECLGIIGKNGAGKSTLLSLLLGTSFPTEGEIIVRGKRTPLIELGAGFHPDLTGRENIYLNGVLLGLTMRQVTSCFSSIVGFSELEPFIDRQVRTYSSGMYLRLAFSVAIHTEPEILLIDEILAVGDESFQKKSEGSLISLIKSGVTTVFVSHNLEAVKKICTRVLWLDQGTIKLAGKPGDVVGSYLRSSV